LNSLLISPYGALGATLASLITYSYVSILVKFYIKELKYFGSVIFASLNLYKAASRLLGAIGLLKFKQTSRTVCMVLRLLGTQTKEKILNQNSEKFFKKCLICGETYDSISYGAWLLIPS